MTEERQVLECCGRVVYVEVVRESVDGRREAFLLLPSVPDFAVTEFHGGCLICGAEYHWSPPVVSLRKLLARYR